MAVSGPTAAKCRLSSRALQTVQIPLRLSYSLSFYLAIMSIHRATSILLNCSATALRSIEKKTSKKRHKNADSVHSADTKNDRQKNKWQPEQLLRTATFRYRNRLAQPSKCSLEVSPNLKASIQFRFLHSDLFFLCLLSDGAVEIKRKNYERNPRHICFTTNQQLVVIHRSQGVIRQATNRKPRDYLIGWSLDWRIVGLPFTVIKQSAFVNHLCLRR